ncbi:MAG: hypothetical protein JW774_07795 [Candidatus Aureabacteria bacterium]|nr:hypothetical protein [Candidatus Auribacterota bacterium]
MKKNKIDTMAMFLVLFALSLLNFSCSGRLAFKRGAEAYRLKNWDMAVDYYLKAVQKDPENPRYRLSLANALIEASDYHCEKGEKFLQKDELKYALLEFQKALDLNPENLRAWKNKKEILQKLEEDKKKQEEKTEIEKAKERAKNIPVDKPPLYPVSEQKINLEFNDADLEKEIFPVIQQMSGINILCDVSFKSKKISIEFLNVTLKEALDKLEIVGGFFYKTLDDNTILIVPDTPQKRSEYEELMLRTFFISNANLGNIQAILRSLTGIKVMAINEELNAITIRANPQEIELAERIISVQDKAIAEILLDVEILEVNKGRLREYGIELSHYQITQSLAPDTLGSEEGSFVRGHMFYNIDSSDFLFAIPSVSYKLLESDSKSKIIAKPQLRIIDGQKLTVKLGDKVPVPVTTFVPIAAGGPSQQAITSYQMYDVGINMEFTPRVHHNGEITLELKFELTFITTPGTSVMPPTIGNRSVETVIRLKDNETSLLAGLLRDTERTTWKGIPALKKIPILNRIFGSTGEEVTQTDIILALTPRITRMPHITEEDLIPLWIGTEKDLGIRPPPTKTPFLEKKIPDQIEETGEQPEAEKEKAGEEKTTMAEEPAVKKEEEKKKETDEKPAVEEKIAAEEASITLFPETAEIQGQKDFKIAINLEKIRNVSSMNAALKFDSSVIRVKEIIEGSFMKMDGINTSFLHSFDNTTGQIQIAISRKGNKGISGSGQIALIIMESIKTGTSDLTITTATVRDFNQSIIPIEYFGATITVLGGRTKLSSRY